MYFIKTQSKKIPSYHSGIQYSLKQRGKIHLSKYLESYSNMYYFISKTQQQSDLILSIFLRPEWQIALVSVSDSTLFIRWVFRTNIGTNDKWFEVQTYWGFQGFSMTLVLHTTLLRYVGFRFYKTQTLQTTSSM